MEKFIKPRLLTPREQDRKKFWQAVGLCALTAAIFFLPFYILDGGFFHYAGDFNSQQISFYRYMNGFVKAGGTFSWATDLGSGTANAYSFYLYGSPFFWLSLLFPQSWLPYLMCPLLVLKFAVAGGGAYLYLRRYVKNANYAVLGACLYRIIIAAAIGADVPTECFKLVSALIVAVAIATPQGRKLIALQRQKLAAKKGGARKC